jgi:hypothetical protein
MRSGGAEAFGGLGGGVEVVGAVVEEPVAEVAGVLDEGGRRAGAGGHLGKAWALWALRDASKSGWARAAA